MSGSASSKQRGEFAQEGATYNQPQETQKKVVAVAKSAGRTIKDTVKIKIFLKLTSDYEEMNKAYKAFFGEIPLPAHTAMEGKLLYDQLLVEIDAGGIPG